MATFAQPFQPLPTRTIKSSMLGDFVDAQGLQDPAALRAASQGTSYDPQARRDAIAAALAQRQQQQQGAGNTSFPSMNSAPWGQLIRDALIPSAAGQPMPSQPAAPFQPQGGGGSSPPPSGDQPGRWGEGETIYQHPDGTIQFGGYPGSYPGGGDSAQPAAQTSMPVPYVNVGNNSGGL